MAFLGICAVGGGSSRADVLSLLYVRPAAFAVIAFFLWRGRLEWNVIRPLIILFALVALLYLAQLCPLPPRLYALLPGRREFDAIAQLNGTAHYWRSFSLDPDATVNALFSLAIPLAVLFGLAGVRPEDRERLLPPVIIVLLVSGTLGVFQIASGAGSRLYFYSQTYPGYAVGLFSNRNHQAAALACLFPLLSVWARTRRGSVTPKIRYGLAAIAAFLIFPLIAATGSRAGLILGVLSLGLSATVIPWSRGKMSRKGTIFCAVAAVATVALMILMLTQSRAMSLQRLLQSDLGGEGRIGYFATEWSIIQTFWPFGVGEGAFDPAIRLFEPDKLLHTTYFNHAHNDYLEVIVVAGLPGLLLLIAGIVMIARWSWIAYRRPFRRDNLTLLARASAVTLFILLAASAVDYPLRSPLMVAIMTIVSVWLRDGALEDASAVRLRSVGLGYTPSIPSSLPKGDIPS